MLRIVVAAPPRIRRPEDLARRLPPCADVIELRLDLLAPFIRDEADLAHWIAAAPRPVLATLRSRAEGGAFDGDPSGAARRIEAAARAGARYVDVERSVAPHVSSLSEETVIVVSHHGSERVPLPAEVAGRRAAWWKVARPVDGGVRLERLRDEAASPAPVPRTLIPYGSLGGVRSMFCPGTGLLYGSAADAEPVVQGQPSLRALLDDLRAGEVTSQALLYGLLGRPPSPSPSPAMHNAAFRRLGLDALYVPLPDLALEDALTLPFRGFSVTTPYKEHALRLAARVDATAKAIGAANTLVRDEEGWIASNTDALALAAAVPEGHGAGAFVYGSGGYARAAAHAFAGRGYVVRVGARDQGRGRQLAEAGGWRYAGATYVRGEDDRVLLNATPAGVDGRLPESLLASDYAGLIVLDAPYAAAGRTTGLEAAALGSAARFVGGRALLALQAHGQVRAFTGQDVQRDVLALAAAPPRPLLLLGLRGAGKSTVGRRAARLLGRPFLDLDREVERITGRPPAAWIREAGLSAFRAAEVRALERVVGRRGIVVAAGGGVLESPRALEIVRAHTIPAWLDVSAEVAAERVVADAQDRPGLAGAGSPVEEAHALLARRRARWAETAAFVVDASGMVDAVAREVAELWIRHARSSRAS